MYILGVFVRVGSVVSCCLIFSRYLCTKGENNNDSIYAPSIGLTLMNFHIQGVKAEYEQLLLCYNVRRNIDTTAGVHLADHLVCPGRIVRAGVLLAHVGAFLVVCSIPPTLESSRPDQSVGLQLPAVFVRGWPAGVVVAEVLVEAAGQIGGFGRCSDSIGRSMLPRQRHLHRRHSSVVLGRVLVVVAAAVVAAAAVVVIGLGLPWH